MKKIILLTLCLTLFLPYLLELVAEARGGGGGRGGGSRSYNYYKKSVTPTKPYYSSKSNKSTSSYSSKSKSKSKAKSKSKSKSKSKPKSKPKTKQSVVAKSTNIVTNQASAVVTSNVDEVLAEEQNVKPLSSSKIKVQKDKFFESKKQIVVVRADEGNLIQDKMYIFQGRLYVSIRAVLNEIGGNLTYNETTIKLFINQRVGICVSESGSEIDLEPFADKVKMFDGTLYIELATIANLLNAEIIDSGFEDIIALRIKGCNE